MEIILHKPNINKNEMY